MPAAPKAAVPYIAAPSAASSAGEHRGPRTALSGWAPATGARFAYALSRDGVRAPVPGTESALEERQDLFEAIRDLAAQGREAIFANATRLFSWNIFSASALPSIPFSKALDI